MLRVLIHVGPGKTGTSAIQNWMQKNRGLLLQDGFYYPEHNLDDNGISSGNARSLFDVKNKDFTFSKIKAQALLDESIKLGVHTLVLSSEAFFSRINHLIEFFDDAEYIYYVRSPLETLESGYNQSVKRHFSIAPLKLPPKLQFGNLDKVDKLMTEQPTLKINFRLYGKAFFKDGDIVKDFLAQIGYLKPIESASKRVNLSYSFEALEFKRQLNRLPEASLHHMLDRELQSFDGDTKKFSVLSESEFERYRTHSIKRLKTFNKKVNIENFDAFVDHVANQKQKPIVVQGDGTSADIVICKLLKQKSPELFQRLCLRILEDKFFGLRETSVGRACMLLLPLRLKVKKWTLRHSLTNKIEKTKLSTKAVEQFRKQAKIPKRVPDAEVVISVAGILESAQQLEAAYAMLIGAMELYGANKKIQNKAHALSVKLMQSSESSGGHK